MFFLFLSSEKEFHFYIGMQSEMFPIDSKPGSAEKKQVSLLSRRSVFKFGFTINAAVDINHIDG